MILLILGVLGCLFFAIADVIGVGRDPTAFGARQTTGTLVSVIVFIVGLVMYLRKRQA
jgi:hypothetical protein